VAIETKTPIKELAKEKETEKKEMVPIHVMGREYMVPGDLTIMKALEFAGYQLVRGVGCRGGICGACGTVYRLPDSYRVEVGLACQTLVKPNMFLAQIPFFPQNKAVYDIEKSEPTSGTVHSLYPEVFKCIGCGTCTRSCPVDVEVMDYMAAAIRGDIARVADLSFDCVMCGLCTARCPAEEAQPLVAILCRRLFSRHIVPRAEHLAIRVRQIEDGKYDQYIEVLIGSDRKALTDLYKMREEEPDMSGPDWRPKETVYI